jgi:hypothetical protein
VTILPSTAQAVGSCKGGGAERICLNPGGFLRTRARTAGNRGARRFVLGGVQERRKKKKESPEGGQLLLSRYGDPELICKVDPSPKRNPRFRFALLRLRAWLPPRPTGSHERPRRFGRLEITYGGGLTAPPFIFPVSAPRRAIVTFFPGVGYATRPTRSRRSADLAPRVIPNGSLVRDASKISFITLRCSKRCDARVTY